MNQVEEGQAQNQPERDPETAAEIELDRLLADPGNKFLEIPKNKAVIDDAWGRSSAEALQVVRDLIYKRLERTFNFTAMSTIDRVEAGNLDFDGVRDIIRAIKLNSREVGKGDDAIVLVNKGEIRELPPEICYKLAMKEKTPRGRNPMSQEFDIHAAFFRASERFPESRIGVPTPFYFTGMGEDKLIAMELLNARSIDDILRGKGTLPDWIDINELCDEWRRYLSVMHEKENLYHRDMHPGNFMISQSQTEEHKMGYVLDFGLSAYGVEGMDPYRKEEGDKVFTYKEDNGIIASAHDWLVDWRRRNGKGV